MTIDDLKFAPSLQTVQTDHQFADPSDYGSVMAFIHQHQADLRSAAGNFTTVFSNEFISGYQF